MHGEGLGCEGPFQRFCCEYFNEGSKRKGIAHLEYRYPSHPIPPLASPRSIPWADVATPDKSASIWLAETAAQRAQCLLGRSYIQLGPLRPLKEIVAATLDANCAAMDEAARQLAPDARSLAHSRTLSHALETPLNLCQMDAVEVRVVGEQ